ncbi:Uncharacterised protein [Mycobacteroides abscessus subsp. abscessus]|nr:Uncharacterised protein [Mycobacteroides abscessus subsp. abscessus]
MLFSSIHKVIIFDINQFIRIFLVHYNPIIHNVRRISKANLKKRLIHQVKCGSNHYGFFSARIKNDIGALLKQLIILFKIVKVRIFSHINDGFSDRFFFVHF